MTKSILQVPGMRCGHCVAAIDEEDHEVTMHHEMF